MGHLYIHSSIRQLDSRRAWSWVDKYISSFICNALQAGLINRWLIWIQRRETRLKLNNFCFQAKTFRKRSLEKMRNHNVRNFIFKLRRKNMLFHAWEFIASNDIIGEKHIFQCFGYMTENMSLWKEFYFSFGELCIWCLECNPIQG